MSWSQRFSHYFFYIACLETHYNLWNLSSTWLFLLTNTINTTDNDSDSVSATNLNACVNSTDDNSCDYFSFNMSLMPSYTNNQLIYYFISDAISAAEQAWFQQLMKQCKILLELLEWNNTSDENNESDISQEDSTILTNVNSDSDCSAFLSDHKSIKINLSDISKLVYNSTVTQYNNWLANLKIDFDKDSARFSTSCVKIILISITLNKQLKIIFNSAVQNFSVLSHHWWKFEHWLWDVVLHDDSDKLKLLKEFTAACQLLKEDLNQFYLWLFNLEI